MQLLVMKQLPPRCTLTQTPDDCWEHWNAQTPWNTMAFLKVRQEFTESPGNLLLRNEAHHYNYHLNVQVQDNIAHNCSKLKESCGWMNK